MHDGAENWLFHSTSLIVFISHRELIQSSIFFFFCYLFYYHKFNFLLLLGVFSRTIIFLVNLRNCHLEVQIVWILSSWGS